MSVNAGKTERFGNQQPSLGSFRERFRDYNGRILVKGSWYSPFQLEIVGVKEPPDAGSIPAPATRL